MRANEGYIPEYFVHLRPTTPMRDPIVIDNAIDKLMNSNFTSLRSVHKMSESAYKAFEIKGDILSRIFDQGTDLDESNHSRQSYPTTYDANGYVDVVRSQLIIEENLLHGNRVLPFLTESTNEIDEKGDIDKVQYLLERNILNINKLFLKDD
jgi:N-acylneuraminate cytidylyltransferase